MELFSVELINLEDLLALLLRFFLNFAVIFIIVRLLYYRNQRRRDYLFTYILISSVIFLLCFLLDNVKLELGFALGLFAIFGIIRYRTLSMPIKEMTYLFLVIGVSVINALANKKISYAELAFTNLALIGITWLLENMMVLKHESTKAITYEKIELIKPERRAELMADLEKRTGIKISRVEVGKIDFLKDTARVNIFYIESENRINQSDNGGNVESDDDDD
jgi:hypothetical protein